MKKIMIAGMLTLLFTIFAGCTDREPSNENTAPGLESEKIDIDNINKPYARYWWFASEIKKEDIKYNLDFLKEHGFGGVEIAWVYPLNAMDENLDSAYTPRQKWLSPEWQDVVEYAARYCDTIGLACDMTLGTLWPFGDSQVPFREATQEYGHPERQQIRKSWEHPKLGYVVDHMTPEHYLPYFNRLLDSFPNPESKITPAYFVDSWEVHCDKLWADGFEDDFREKFGYDIRPFMDSLYAEGNEAMLYDYRKLVSDRVVRFYSDFDSVLNARGIMSRAQCSGAPCDIISAYSRIDVPEGEAMLYEPEYCQIPASAALYSGKKTVSAETFTCLYGWPRNHIREEQTADLKMLADALFANGINHIVWHGKAHNPKDADSVNFYASVHIGKDGSLYSELKDFNQYLASVTKYMKKGRPVTDVAVYLPTEDAWRGGFLPKDKQFIWARGKYEMRYVYYPEELYGYCPAWINNEYLQKAVLDNGILKIGDAEFNSLYVDVEYLEYGALKKLEELARAGFRITMKQKPQAPGKNIEEDYAGIVDKILSYDNVSREVVPKTEPIVETADSDIAFDYRVRRDGDDYYIFFANPKSKNLKFPVRYGLSFSEDTLRYDCKINIDGNRYHRELTFAPYTSLLYKISDGRIEKIDIDFIPKTPKVSTDPPDPDAPWLVK